MNSIKNLLAERQRLDGLLDEARRLEKDHAVRQIAELATLYGIDILEIARAPRSRPRRKPADPPSRRAFTIP
ncbi:MAG: hypothetical protein WDN30_03825 [Pararobbsia sp.]